MHHHGFRHPHQAGDHPHKYQAARHPEYAGNAGRHDGSDDNDESRLQRCYAQITVEEKARRNMRSNMVNACRESPSV